LVLVGGDPAFQAEFVERAQQRASVLACESAAVVEAVEDASGGVAGQVGDVAQWEGGECVGRVGCGHPDPYSRLVAAGQQPELGLDRVEQVVEVGDHVGEGPLRGAAVGLPPSAPPRAQAVAAGAMEAGRRGHRRPRPAR
jgi:hypothetical protein